MPYPIKHSSWVRARTLQQSLSLPEDKLTLQGWQAMWRACLKKAQMLSSTQGNKESFIMQRLSPLGLEWISGAEINVYANI